MEWWDEKNKKENFADDDDGRIPIPMYASTEIWGGIFFLRSTFGAKLVII